MGKAELICLQKGSLGAVATRPTTSSFCRAVELKYRRYSFVPAGILADTRPMKSLAPGESHFSLWI